MTEDRSDLKGIKVAILVCDGFEEVEMTLPRAALEQDGAVVDLIAPVPTIKSWDHVEWGRNYPADVLLEEADPTLYDALVLPGGVINPDKLRTIPSAIEFVRYFLLNHKTVAAICHGPWTLIETKMISGRKMTSYPSIKTDLCNAGVEWLDQPVVIDGCLITSRRPNDIPDFVRALKNTLVK